MNTIKIKGKEINLIDYICRDLTGDYLFTSDLKINLYIQLNHDCNAKCKFCTSHGTYSEFDYAKFIEALNLLIERDLINRIGITGGEPSLHLDRLQEVLNIINNRFDGPVTMNTNGSNLLDLIELDLSCLDALHISRHHYSDHVNNSIFGIEVASTEDIIIAKKILDDLYGHEFLRMNSVLMDGYIDNEVEITNYLQYAIDLDIFRVGFVGLMRKNDFTTNNYIDYRSFRRIGVPLFSREDHNYCRCSKGVFYNEFGDSIEYYFREVDQPRLDSSSAFIFDGSNLKAGFLNPIIIL